MRFDPKKNYCTGWLDGNWGDCCFQHDIDYTCKVVSRGEADRYFRG